MKVRQKTIIFFNAVLLVVCLVLGVMGYRTAATGFDMTLTEKAHYDLNQVLAIIDRTYPGDWSYQNGEIFKGSQKLNEAFDVVDSLGKLCGDNVTVFAGDTRVATTFKDASGKRLINTKASQAVVDQVLKGGKDFVGEAEILGGSYLCAYRPIKDMAGQTVGMMFVGIPQDELNAVQNSFIIKIAVVSLILLVVVGLLSYMAIGTAVGPLEEVTDALVHIADCDLRGRDIAVKGDDEIATLARSCNKVQEVLRSLMTSVTESAQQVAAASEELTASTSETARSVQNVAESVVAMAEGAGEQSNELDNVSRQTDGMNAQMKTLYDDSQAMKQAAQDGREGAEQGKASVDQAVGSMEDMANQMANASKLVSTLGDRSKEIGQIVDTISGIAAQTNLLALNAAIEAARAGEAGRGFAVVAEEVRKLAEQSGDAASSISSLIGGIQHDTVDAVEAMQKSNDAVQSSREVVADAGAAFAKINDLVQKLYAHTQSSIESINDATSSSQAVMEAVEKIKTVSSKTANEAQTVSASTEEQASMMHEMSEAAHSLADMAQNLRGDIAKFKL